MANLIFYYSTMNAGKTIDLIKTAFNYKTENIPIRIFTSSVDTRSGKNKVKSRMGIEEDAISIKEEDNLYEIVKTQKLGAILVDEVQFFTIEHIWQLFQIVHKLKIPVVCYGLRGDFRGNPFPASAQLMAIANKVEELRSICFCGAKAIINARIVDDKIVYDGEQIMVGGNESYKPLCASHWINGQHKKE
ncbi:MAG: thymidine kinase [bacterium]